IPTWATEPTNEKETAKYAKYAKTESGSRIPRISRLNNSGVRFRKGRSEGRNPKKPVFKPEYGFLFALLICYRPIPPAGRLSGTLAHLSSGVEDISKTKSPPAEIC